jgi:hypothetical protein
MPAVTAGARAVGEGAATRRGGGGEGRGGGTGCVAVDAALGVAVDAVLCNRSVGFAAVFRPAAAPAVSGDRASTRKVLLPPMTHPQ